MSGVGTDADTVPREKPQGIYTRLKTHAAGRRSGDQFCVYVADRFVLPTLSQEDITEIAEGRHQMDALVRRYIHKNLSYRFPVHPTLVSPEQATHFIYRCPVEFAVIAIGCEVLVGQRFG